MREWSRDVPGAEALALGTAFADQFKSPLLKKTQSEKLGQIWEQP